MPGINTLSRALADLRREGPLSGTAADDIGCIHEILDEAFARETLGYRNVFDGTNDPDFGVIGQVRSVPILSDKDGCLDILLQQFRTALAMRDLLAARVDAELQIARLKAT